MTRAERAARERGEREREWHELFVRAQDDPRAWLEWRQHPNTCNTDPLAIKHIDALLAELDREREYRQGAEKMLNAVHAARIRDRMKERNEAWSEDVPPGGVVCAECGEPVESEPCELHGGGLDVAEIVRGQMHEALNRLTDVTDERDAALAELSDRDERITQLIADLDLAREDYSRHLRAEVKRLTPREITTVAELRTLPAGARVLDANGRQWAGNWPLGFGAQGGPPLPATVLYLPEGGE